MENNLLCEIESIVSNYVDDPNTTASEYVMRREAVTVVLNKYRSHQSIELPAMRPYWEAIKQDLLILIDGVNPTELREAALESCRVSRLRRLRGLPFVSKR